MEWCVERASSVNAVVEKKREEVRGLFTVVEVERYESG